MTHLCVPIHPPPRFLLGSRSTVLATHSAHFRSPPEVLFEALQYYVHLILTAFMLPRFTLIGLYPFIG